jgi:hypothetical protein
VSDPAGTPPIGTDPLRFAALFLIRDTGGIESLEGTTGVASISDLVAHPVSELRFFDVQGPHGRELYAGGGPSAGDVLVFPAATPTGSLAYWLEDSAPYLTNEFTVLATRQRQHGLAPQVLSGNQIRLPDYTFTPEDRNRWIVLSGFAANPAYNGPAQILTVAGSVATIDKPTSALETGTTWALPYIEIQPAVSAFYEPRYFPTRESNLAWSLRSGAATVTSATSGGMTLRSTPGTLIRSTRFTEINATMDQSLNTMESVRVGAALLQRAAQRENTAFTALLTSTYGP